MTVGKHQLRPACRLTKSNISWCLQIFSSRTSELIAYHQVEVAQIYPKEGYVKKHYYVPPSNYLATGEWCEMLNNLF